MTQFDPGQKTKLGVALDSYASLVAESQSGFEVVALPPADIDVSAVKQMIGLDEPLGVEILRQLEPIAFAQDPELGRKISDLIPTT